MNDLSTQLYQNTMHQIQQKQAALPSVDQLIPHVKAALDQVSQFIINKIEEYATQNEKYITRLSSMKKSLQTNYDELNETKQEWQIPIFKSVAESIQTGLTNTKVRPLKIDAKGMCEILWDFIQGKQTTKQHQEDNLLFSSGVFSVPKSHAVQQELYMRGFECQYQNNFKKAIEAWEQSAALGNPGALAALGYGYQEFKDIPTDLLKGVRMLEQGAAKGSAVAINSLAFCYEFGIGVAKSQDKSRILYELAANHGSASACHNLAILTGKSNPRLTSLYLKRAEELSVKELVGMKDIMKF